MDAATEFARRQHDLLRAASEAVAEAQKKQAHYANQRRRPLSFAVGETVLLSTDNITLKASGQSRKLHPKFIGPFPITARIGENAYRLQLPEQYSRIHDVFNVDRLRPFRPTDPAAFPGRDVHDRPPPLLEDEQDGYTVEAILDKCRVRAGNYRLVDYYLVKWAGYPDSDATWKPAAHLKPPHAGDGVQEMIAAYDAQHAEPARVVESLPTTGVPELPARQTREQAKKRRGRR